MIDRETHPTAYHAFAQYRDTDELAEMLPPSAWIPPGNTYAGSAYHAGKEIIADRALQALGLGDRELVQGAPDAGNRPRRVWLDEYRLRVQGPYGPGHGRTVLARCRAAAIAVLAVEALEARGEEAPAALRAMVTRLFVDGAAEWVDD